MANSYDTTNWLTAYWISRSDAAGKLFAGTTPQECADVVKSELEDPGIYCDEQIIISACKMTPCEIAALPEFQGWS